jgi:type II secretory pathway pseudopilin PulG
VVVLVIVGLLFIIGLSLLAVASFERKTVEQQAAARDIRTVADALQNIMLDQLREDVVGKDGMPYNRGWGPDSSIIEDYADFPGLAE